VTTIRRPVDRDAVRMPGVPALALTASALLTGLCVPVAGAPATRRQGLRIAPLVLPAGAPVTFLVTFAPLLRS